MYEHPVRRQGYWEAEESGMKKLCEHETVNLGRRCETGKEKEAMQEIGFWQGKLHNGSRE